MNILSRSVELQHDYRQIDSSSFLVLVVLFYSQLNYYPFPDYHCQGYGSFYSIVGSHNGSLCPLDFGVRLRSLLYPATSYILQELDVNGCSDKPGVLLPSSFDNTLRYHITGDTLPEHNCHDPDHNPSLHTIFYAHVHDNPLFGSFDELQSYHTHYIRLLATNLHNFVTFLSDRVHHDLFDSGIISNHL